MSLKISDVSVDYAGTRALDDVSVTLLSGVTALLGVNGAGKSTLMSVSAGLLRPGTGSVHVAARSLYGPERRDALRKVSLMPQTASFPPSMTPKDVVTYMGWLKGLSGSEAAERAGDCLARVGLSAVANRRCKSLSGGMLRRVALAQALVSHPEVLLLDEPSTGLDPEQRRVMVEIIRELDCTVLLSSHVVEDVADLAARVMVLDGGRLVYDGTTTELSERGDQSTGRSALETGFLTVIGRGTSA